MLKESGGRRGEEGDRLGTCVAGVREYMNRNVCGSKGYSPCRLAGFENTLLGYKTRLYKLLKEHLNAIDVIMFGKKTLPLSWSPPPPPLLSLPSNCLSHRSSHV